MLHPALLPGLLWKNQTSGIVSPNIQLPQKLNKIFNQTKGGGQIWKSPSFSFPDFFLRESKLFLGAILKWPYFAVPIR